MVRHLNIKNTQWVMLQQFDDAPDGSLFIAENNKQIPFAIKRVYFINNLENKNALRGMHAHKTLEQAIFCIKGSFELELYDGTKEQKVILDNPQKGVYMGPGVWHAMRGFAADSILLVISSQPFQEAEYIRDFREFKLFTKKKRTAK